MLLFIPRVVIILFGFGLLLSLSDVIGSLQFLGDNVLALIQSILQDDSLSAPHPNAGLAATLVFFDVFGMIN
jgi:hypothetical protein